MILHQEGGGGLTPLTNKEKMDEKAKKYETLRSRGEGARTLVVRPLKKHVVLGK